MYTNIKFLFSVKFSSELHEQADRPVDIIAPNAEHIVPSAALGPVQLRQKCLHLLFYVLRLSVTVRA